jgi:GNAT superfamily N-acetyltransferase
LTRPSIRQLNPLQFQTFAATMLKTRTVRASDLDLVCRHREAMFRAAGQSPDEVLAEMTVSFRRWLQPRLADGSYFGFIVEDGDLPVAGIGLMMIDWPPHPSHPSQDKRGYVLNVFVEPPYWRQGLGRMLMKLAESDFRDRGIGFSILHATTAGRFLYEQLGWTATSEMAKSLSQ